MMDAAFTSAGWALSIIALWVLAVVLVLGAFSRVRDANDLTDEGREMGDKIRRERRLYKGELVTILESGKRKTKIRTAHGFPQEVPTRDLSLPNDPADRSYVYEEPDAS